MSKNLSKIGAVFFVAITIILLLVYGNPNAPPIIEDGKLKLVADKDIKNSNINFFKNNDKILIFDPFRMQIKYKGEFKRIFEYASNITLFNGNDSKKVEVEGNKIIITYFNDQKDPSEIRIIFDMNNNSLTYKIEGNFSNLTKFEQIIYGYSFGSLNYKEFITPSDDVIKNEGNESYTWQAGIQIPKTSKNEQLMISNETMLNVSGNFTSIWNSLRYQMSWPYVNPNETITIKVQEPVKINLTKTGLSLRIGENLNAPLIEFYNESKKILIFDPFRMQIKYEGEFKRIFGYASNITLFNGNDSKKVEVEGNKMIITYFNDQKDPSEIRIIFDLNNNSLTYKIEGNFSNLTKFEQIIYGYSFGSLNYKEFITPSDDVIKNEGNESYTWQAGIQIPKTSKNEQLMISNETMLNVSGNFNKIWNAPMYQVSYLYVNPNETLTIKVQEPIKINLTQNYPLTVSTSSTISDGIHIYKNGTQILSLSPWEAIFKHDGRTQNLLNTKKYDENYPNKLIFNYNNSEKITKISEIKQNNKTIGYEMNVSWINESMDVQEVGFNIKIYENKSYAEIKYIYRTKNAYVNLDPLFYGISFDKNKFKYVKVVRDSEITGNIKRNPVENEKKGYLNFAGCEQGKACDKIIADQWFIDKGDKTPEKAVEINGNFSRIEHYFTYNLVRFYMNDFKEPLRIYAE
ncbi:exported hypothetical protein [groundwater metagenome]|uniref:Uncharacterized protein n=1 Tax=groundwater metagenome TaxID=717931 RepID=A0A098ED26_9ZZZZ